MAGVMPATYQEAMMKLLQQISVSMAAPDADLNALTQMQAHVLAQIRGPVDTPVAGSPVAGAGMDMSAGAPSPAAGGPAPAGLSPMLQALLAAGQGGAGVAAAPSGNPAGSVPTHGLMAGPAAPNMDELRRTMAIG